MGSRIVNKEDKIVLSTFHEKREGLISDKLSNPREQMKFLKDEYTWFYENIFRENEANRKKEEN